MRPSVRIHGGDASVPTVHTDLVPVSRPMAASKTLMGVFLLTFLLFRASPKLISEGLFVSLNFLLFFGNKQEDKRALVTAVCGI